MQAERPRTPGLVLLVVAVVVTLLVAVIALTSRQPPPPSVAEFAPQAVDNITDAPADQSSSEGRGPGTGPGDGGGGFEATPTPAPPIDVPRVRKCVGDPPRQIEDPQSPPCVPYWSGDNGGATSKGVTRDQINVVAPEGADLALEAFFNKRFEFYGRHLKLIDGASLNTIGAEGERADATRVDEEMHAFASLNRDASSTTAYYLELARLGIISAAAKTKWSAAVARENRPYIWTYPMHLDRMFGSLGDWTCARLAGRPATHQGGTRAPVRVFGVILHREDPGERITAAPLLDSLARCGATVKVMVEATGSDQVSSSFATNTMLQMQREGVSTIYCLCVQQGHPVYGAAATNQAYFPEWIVTSYVQEESDNAETALGFPAEQREHLMALSFRPKQQRPENWPPRWAAVEGGSNSTPVSSMYRTLLLVASGIQMAGPRLTPHAFESALQSTRFPNPSHPLMAGAVGFAPNDWSMTDDATEMWWSNAGVNPMLNSAGAYCYVRGGVRYLPGAWPAGPDEFFAGTCDSGA